MTFYNSDQSMHSHLTSLLNKYEEEGRPGLKDSIAITWIRYTEVNPSPCSGLGTGWSEDKLLYPASVVKIIYAIAAEAWIQKELIPDNEELRNALKAMVADSSNDATSLVIDLLTGTTSGPALTGDRWNAWQIQRGLINKWLNSLCWEELNKINCCQKTWEDSPYGRERNFYGIGNTNRNALSTLATARILEGIMTDALVSPPACRRTKKILSRSLDLIQRKNDPENQVDGFIGEGLPQGTRLWSKAGLMSQARHDAAWSCSPDGKAMLLIIFSQGQERAKDTFLLPAIANELFHYHLYNEE